MKKPEAWTAYDQGDPVSVYDASEVDEYVTAIERRLAEVTAERDRLKDEEEKGVRDYLDLQDISDRNQRHLGQLLYAVDELRRKDERACRYYTPENIVDKRDAVAKVCAIAAEIRKETH